MSHVVFQKIISLPDYLTKLMCVGGSSQLDGPRCVLLGDAGHPMTSTLAQVKCYLLAETVRVDDVQH